jgi:hypothetical protein
MSFCLHQVPEEIDDTQSTFGGNLGGHRTRPIRIARWMILLDFCLINPGCLLFLIICLAEGDWAFFVSSGNKE